LFSSVTCVLLFEFSRQSSVPMDTHQTITPVCHLLIITAYFVPHGHSVDIPDTSGLNWRDAVIQCLESVYPRSRTQPDPEAVPSPATTEESCEPLADGELPPAVAHQLVPEDKRSAWTL